jgi:plasmid stabilization system protein ParE
MKVVWSRRAVQHLVALREYIAKDSEQSAVLVATRILDAIELLQTQPEMGRPGRVVGTRELVIPDTPYIIPSGSNRAGGAFSRQSRQFSSSSSL